MSHLSYACETANHRSRNHSNTHELSEPPESARSDFSFGGYGCKVVLLCVMGWVKTKERWIKDEIVIEVCGS